MSIEEPTFAQDSIEEPPMWPDRPLLNIWIKPRTTIRAIVDTDPGRYVLILAALYGINNFLAQASTRFFFGDSYSPVTIFFMALIGGSAGGLFSLYVVGAIFRWAGGLLNGQASSEEVRAAMGWSAVPTIFAMVLWLPQLAIYGQEMFTSFAPSIDNNPWPLLCVGLIDIVVGIWTLILLVLTLAEVHRFSVIRAIGTVFIPALVIGIPLVGCLVITIN